MEFKLEDIFNKSEIELISKNIKIENKLYTKDDLRLLRSNIIDGIFSESSKNGYIQKANEQYSNIIEKLEWIKG